MADDINGVDLPDCPELNGRLAAAERAREKFVASIDNRQFFPPRSLASRAFNLAGYVIVGRANATADLAFDAAHVVLPYRKAQRNQPNIMAGIVRL